MIATRIEYAETLEKQGRKLEAERQMRLARFEMIAESVVEAGLSRKKGH